ncbi:MAG: hypothetical protein ABJR05_02190 [Balneola sp.]
MKYIYNRFLIITLSLIAISCSDNTIDNYDFSPLEPKSVLKFEQELNIQDDFFKKDTLINLPDFTNTIYKIQSSDGVIYFNDSRAIYTLNVNLEIEEYFVPKKGKGPAEVTQIFRFDILKDSVIAIANYPEQRVLIHDLVRDTAYVLQTKYDNDVLIRNSNNFIALKTNSETGKMFQTLSLWEDKQNSFGELFNNQIRSLDMLNAHIDTYNRESFVIAFNSVGYMAGFNFDGSTTFLAESSIFPGFIGKYITRNGISYFDDEGKTITNALTVGENEFHVFTRLFGNKKGEILGSIIDVFDLQNGQYMYSYKLDEEIDEFELVSDSILVGITEQHQLGVWKKE